MTFRPLPVLARPPRSGSFAWGGERWLAEHDPPDDPTANAFDEAQHPRDAHGRFIDIPGPVDLTMVKKLSGSTGAWLGKRADGTQWVVKKFSADHAKNEVMADDIYRALGVPVPDSAVVNGAKVSKFLPDAKTLGELEKVSPNADESAFIKHVHDELRQHFVADALLGNWDVIGLDKDNVLVKNADDAVYRIDNGGALKYRAKGELKGDAFGPMVTELQSMRDPKANPVAASVFDKLTDKEIQQQIQNVVAKEPEILKAAAGDPKVQEILAQRLDYLKGLVKDPSQMLLFSAAVTPPPPTPAVTPSGADNPLHTPKGLADYLKKKVPGLTPLILKNVEYLNPGGVKSGVFTFPNYKQHLDALQKVLPPGTTIKIGKYFSKAALEAMDKGEKPPPPPPLKSKLVTVPDTTLLKDLKNGNQFYGSDGKIHTVLKVAKVGNAYVKIHTDQHPDGQSFDKHATLADIGYSGATPATSPATPAKDTSWLGVISKVQAAGYSHVSKSGLMNVLGISLAKAEEYHKQLVALGHITQFGTILDDPKKLLPVTPATPAAKPPAAPEAKPLPATYGGLEPGHKYVNSQSQLKEVESITKDGANVKVKFKGETGEAVVPADKLFKFSAPGPTFGSVDVGEAKVSKTKSKSYAHPPAGPAPDFEEKDKKWKSAQPMAEPGWDDKKIPEIKEGKVDFPDYKTQTNGFWSGKGLKEHQDWVKGLNSTEHSAISGWKGSPSSYREEYLSKNPGTYTTALMNAITRQKPWSGVAYRGIKHDHADVILNQAKQALESNGVIEYNSPHGLSAKPSVGIGFSSNKVLLRVRVRSARPIMHAGSGYSYEMEMINMPGTKYRVLGIHDNVHVDGYHAPIKHVIDLEEVKE